MLSTDTRTDATDTVPAAAPAGYALDQAWHAERDRLNSLTQLFDDTTLRIATALGFGPGWRCADIGAGTGTVAQALADAVGPDGTVLATDLDIRFLEPIASATLEVRRHHIATEPLPEAAFDLIHARLLLEHLPERDAVLSSLVDALAPGGWLFIEDFDWVTTSMVDPPSAVHQRVTDACLALFARHAYSPSFGRRLPRELARRGLADVRTHAHAAQVQADAERGVPQWELLVDQLSPGLLAYGLVTQDDLDAFHQLWHDGESVCFAPLMVSCWGRRPERGVASVS